MEGALFVPGYGVSITAHLVYLSFAILTWYVEAYMYRQVLTRIRHLIPEL